MGRAKLPLKALGRHMLQASLLASDVLLAIFGVSWLVWAFLVSLCFTLVSFTGAVFFIN